MSAVAVTDKLNKKSVIEELVRTGLKTRKL